jgi:hypothetical protein
MSNHTERTVFAKGSAASLCKAESLAAAMTASSNVIDDHGVTLTSHDHPDDQTVEADSSDGEIDDTGFTELESSMEYRQRYHDPAEATGDLGSSDKIPDSQVISRIYEDGKVRSRLRKSKE